MPSVQVTEAKAKLSGLLQWSDRIPDASSLEEVLH